MPSLSTFFRKRRSLQTQPPPNDATTASHGDNGNIDKPRKAGRPDFINEETPSPFSPLSHGYADAGLADSSDEQPVAAPIVATGPWRRHSQQHPPQAGTAGRLNRYVSTHDPFRRFRSRSMQFRFSSGDGNPRADSSEVSWSESPEAPAGAGAQTQARTTWAQSTAAPQEQHEQDQQQRVTMTEDWPLKTTEVPVPSSGLVSARDASLAALQRPSPPPASARAAAREDQVAQLQAFAGQEHKRPRPSSEVGPAGTVEKHMHKHTKSSTSFATSGGPNKLQKLKRLPSLSLKRGFSRRAKKEDTPNVVVTPAALVSQQSSFLCFNFCVVCKASILPGHSLASIAPPCALPFLSLGRVFMQMTEQYFGPLPASSSTPHLPQIDRRPDPCNTLRSGSSIEFGVSLVWRRCPFLRPTASGASALGARTIPQRPSRDLLLVTPQHGSAVQATTLHLHTSISPLQSSVRVSMKSKHRP